MIIIKSDPEVDLMRQAGRITRLATDLLAATDRVARMMADRLGMMPGGPVAHVWDRSQT